MAIALTTSSCAAAEPTAKSPATEITIEQTDYAGFFKAVEKHKGKVVLVDVWAEF
jgi:hypothetical protein